MRVDGYTLDLYCDNDSDHHRHNEFPHTYTDEHGSVCRKNARKEGWIIGRGNGKDYCPKCAKFMREQMKAEATKTAKRKGDG